MDVILLGTGSPIPNPQRAGPATLVRAGGVNLLADCGRGVVMRLAAVGVPPPAISAVLLTHMHSDHITDLNDIITTHWVMNFAPTPLKVFGPKGAKALVEATLAMLAFDVRYRIDHHADLNAGPLVETTELSPGDSFTIISNLSATAVFGTFIGTDGSTLSNGADFVADGTTFQIDYTANPDGQDVVLTAVVPEPSSLLLTALGVFALWTFRRRKCQQA